MGRQKASLLEELEEQISDFVGGECLTLRTISSQMCRRTELCGELSAPRSPGDFNTPAVSTVSYFMICVSVDLLHPCVCVISVFCVLNIIVIDL